MFGSSIPPIVRREETLQRPSAYSGGHFFEIHVGDVYQGHYIVVEKLGYGMQATVWLVHDLYKDRYFAMKVLSTECTYFFEVEVLEHLGFNGSQDPGHQYVSKLVDSFSKQSPIGTTVFLIFDVMAETLPHFMERIGCMSPQKIIKKFVKQLLLALDHAHKSGVVHTDIKPDNIMIQLPNESIIKDAVTPWKPFRVENKEPNFLYWPNDNCDLMRRQHGIDYTMMLDIEPERQTSFGMGEFYLHDDVAEDDILSLNVSLCDWGLASWADEHLYEDISSITMKSPEVLLGAPWDTKTDIWSLGIVLFELLSRRHMFECVRNETQYRYLTEEEREEQNLKRQQERKRRWEKKQEMPQADEKQREFRESENRYDLGVHLNEIATMIEPFPQSLLDGMGGGKEHSRHLKSLFSNDGTIWGYEEYNRLPLEDHFPDMPEGEDKDYFLDLLYKMMRVDPKDRASAEELLKEPWLQDVVLDEEISPLTPLPTPPSCTTYSQPSIDTMDYDTVDRCDADTSNACVEAMVSGPTVDINARAGINMTDSDDKIVNWRKIDSLYPRTQGTTRISGPLIDVVAQPDINIAIAGQEVTRMAADCVCPQATKTRTPPQTKGKSNAGKKKKNKKRKRGGKR